MSNYDVTIIGASLAGSTLAWKLGGLGLRVALIDRQQFPRAKACGEGLSRRGAEALNRMGLSSVLSESQAYPLNGYQLWINRAYPIVIDGSNPLLGVTRRKLDSTLLSHASKLTSVTLFLGKMVRSVDLDAGVVAYTDGMLRSSFIVDATGGQLRIRQNERRESSTGYGVTYQVRAYRTSPLDKVHVLSFGECEVFCTPLADDLINISLLVSRKKERNGTLSFDTSATLRDTLDILEYRGCEVSNRCAAPLALRRQASTVGASLVRVGDSCEQFDPIGGMGMTHAILSAELAADAIGRVFEDEKERTNALRQYSNERERIARELRAFTMLTGLGVRRLGKVPVLGEFLIGRGGARLSRAVHHSKADRILDQKLLSTLGAAL